MGQLAPIVDKADPVLGSGFFAILLLGLVAIAAVSDARRRRIPNSLLLSLAGVGLTASVWLRPLPDALVLSLSGFVVGGVVWLGPYLLRMAGGADLKLAAAIGVWLGPLSILQISLHAAVIGGSMAFLWLVWKRGALGSWVVFSSLPRTAWSGIVGDRRKLMVPDSLPFALAMLIAVGLEFMGVSLFGGAR